MEFRRNTNGLLTFLEHWNFLLCGLATLVLGQIVFYFMALRGEAWIHFFVAGFTSLIAGASLVLFAKIPVYRSGQFLTLGAKTIPAGRVSYYRWGWRLFLCGVALSSLLLLSRP